MRKWYVSDDQLSTLLAVICLLGFVISSYRRDTPRKSKGQISMSSHAQRKVPTLDGSALYYEQARWPVYDARFNLRLSFLHGPVVRVKQGPGNLFTALIQQLNTIFLYVTGQPPPASDTIILINSLAGDNGTLKTLLNASASRAPSIAAGKYLSRGHRIVLMPHGPEWLRHRRAFAALLTREKVRTLWAGALRVEAMVLVERLAANVVVGTRLVDEVSRFTASTVLQIAYARRAATPEDPVLKDLEVVSRNIASAFQPGRYKVESFALLDIFPAFLLRWKRKLNADHDFEASLFSSLLQDVERRLGSRESQRQQSPEIVTPVKECAAAQLLRGQQQASNGGLDRDSIAYLAAGMFEAGTETTAMTINTFLLGAACDPEFTRRTQAELDGMMASKYADDEKRAAPSFEDLVDLPLLAAFVKEALRLTPSGSSGVGHTRAETGSQSFDLSCSKPGEKGNLSERLDVPSGATVLANIYGLHHDSETFRDPWRFNPRRWLLSPTPTLDHTYACYAFGFGKRICPGSTLACYSLSMAIALLLLCFDFSMADAAARIYAEMKTQVGDEYSAWERLFGQGGREAMERERTLKKGNGPRSWEDEVGCVLTDAHVAFKLSRAQVGECVRLVPREDGVGLAVVRDGLAALRG